MFRIVWTLMELHLNTQKNKAGEKWKGLMTLLLKIKMRSRPWHSNSFFLKNLSVVFLPALWTLTVGSMGNRIMRSCSLSFYKCSLMSMHYNNYSRIIIKEFFSPWDFLDNTGEISTTQKYIPLEIHTFKNLLSLFYRSVNKVSEKLMISTGHTSGDGFLIWHTRRADPILLFFPFVLMVFSIMKL